ncbi:MAG TPA: DUF4342 domain-containing protein [Anaerovoracaceae bacterium]|nr:DUF4342 domain-containing protein [Anaerovoracaceae bacterium]
MEISLEKIELVKDRTGVGYKEAKEALGKTEGNVVDAIILIEETIDEAGKSKMGAHGADMIDAIKDAIRKGNVTKITIKKKDGEILLNLPVSIGIIGTVLFPWAAVGATIAAFGTKCTIELLKDDGEIVNISEKASETFDTVVSKGSVIVDEMKDKSEDFVEVAKEKGQDAWTAAKGKGADVVDAVKDKAAERTKRASKEEELDGLYDFDLSDVEDVVETVAETVEEKAETVADAVEDKVKEMAETLEDKAEEVIDSEKKQ